jgi:(p)ppGpp synthase/HD superfamily hydrolase
MLFSPRIDLAFRIAAVAHASQLRKGTSLPYVSHPVHVARLLERAGLPEDLVVAGLLHDVLEDLDADDAATQDRFRQEFPALAGTSMAPDVFRDAVRAFLAESFGEDVVRLVLAVTEQKEEGGVKRPWIARKREAVAHLAHAPHDVVALKAADVLHNVRSILHDLTVPGADVMKRFNAGPEETLWYYASVAGACRGRLDGAAASLAEELDAAVRELQQALRRTR